MQRMFDSKNFPCCGFRKPRQMLAHQEYGGQVSIHDNAMA